MATPGSVENLTFLAAGLLGLGPALALMFLAFRQYDHPHVEKALFSDGKLFGSFAVGMIMGTISAAAANLLLFVGNDFTTVLLVLFLVAVFDEGFKLMYLNMKLLGGRFDLTFYGGAAGLAMGGTSAMAYAYLALQSALGFTAVPFAFSFTMALGLVGTEFFTGALLGSGAFSHRTVQPLLESLAARGLLAGLMALLLSSPLPELGWAAGATVAATGVGLAWAAHTSVVPGALPEEVHRTLRRRRRRTAAGAPQTRR